MTMLRSAFFVFVGSLALAATSWGAEPPKPLPAVVGPAAAKTMTGPSGRFVFGPLSEFNQEQYMFDTQTGRLWVLTKNKAKAGEESPHAPRFTLEPVPYMDLDGKAAQQPR